MKAEFKTISESESMARMRAYIERNAAHIENDRERQEFRATWDSVLTAREARLIRGSTGVGTHG